MWFFHHLPLFLSHYSFYRLNLLLELLSHCMILLLSTSCYYYSLCSPCPKCFFIAYICFNHTSIALTCLTMCTYSSVFSAFISFSLSFKSSSSFHIFAPLDLISCCWSLVLVEIKCCLNKSFWLDFLVVWGLFPRWVCTFGFGFFHCLGFMHLRFFALLFWMLSLVLQSTL